MKPIVNFYKEFLKDILVTVNKDDSLIIPATSDNKYKPLAVYINDGNNRKLMPIYLPTDKVMELEEDGTKLMYHPACESVLRGNSEILNKTIALMKKAIYVNAIGTVDSLLRVAADTEKHSKLPLPLMDLIAQLPQITKGTIGHWANVVDKTSMSSKMPVFRFKLEREKAVSGVRYSRVATISSPLLESEGLYGINMSKTAMVAINKAFELVVGDLPVIKGSMSPTAPSFIATASVFSEFMSKVKRVSDSLGKHRLFNMTYEGKWASKLDKLHDWYTKDMYLQLTGNIGTGDIGSTEVEIAEPAEFDVEPLQGVNKTEVKKVAEKTENGLPVFKIPSSVQTNAGVPGGGMQQQPYQQPVYQQQPYQQPVYQQVNQQPMYQQPGTTYYDPRTGKHRPTGNTTVNTTVAQQPQPGGNVNYPPVPGLSGPMQDSMGNVYYVNPNTGVSISGNDAMVGLRSQAGGQPIQQAQTFAGYDNLGMPIYR